MTLLTQDGTRAVVMSLSARLQNMQTNEEIEVNVFLDTCSNVTLLTQDAANRLNLKCTDMKFSLSGIGDKKTSMDSSFVDAVTLKSMDGTSTTLLEKVQVIPVITNDVTALNWIPHLKKHNIRGYPPVGNGQIDLLIGTDYPALTLHRDYVEQKGGPVLIKTSLGWSGFGILSRKELASMQNCFLEFSNPDYPKSSLDEEEQAPAKVSSQEEDEGDVCGEEELNSHNHSFLSLHVDKQDSKTDIKALIDLIEKSYKYDNFSETGNSVEDEYCMKLLQNSFEIKDGIAYVSPLWREGQPSGFTTNYAYCHNRLKSILKGMSEEDFDCIDKIFEGYIEKGIVDEITDEVDKPYEEKAIWWPHFPVKQPKSETTPVRPVNDGRAKCINGKSINDQCFHAGPQLMCDLVKVLLRSRMYDVLVSADISQMFPSIRVPEEQKKYMRFMWVHKDDKSKPRYFQYKGHLLGKVCSPTCCIYVTQQNATNHQAEFPRAAEAIKESTVVDDTLDSVPTSGEAISLMKDVITINGKIGLKMVKISTNSLEVAKGLPDTVSKSKNMLLYERERFGPKDPDYAPGTVPKYQIRTLGQYLKLSEDIYTYSSYEADQNLVWTKTKCLSQAHKIYDPLGFAIPVLLESKLFMQDLWRRKCEWTDSLTELELERWKNWLINLPLMENLSFRRVLCPGLPKDFKSVQIHVFADASKVAFNAVAYVRVEYKDNRPIYVNFIQAKNNIAPIEPARSIPRLELMGLESAGRLAKALCEKCKFKEENVTLWTDATTALQWLRMDSKTLLPLIHNYCVKTQNLFPLEQIRWVPGPENPADFGTRPKSVQEMVDYSPWANGPNFLYSHESTWPKLPALEHTKEVMDEVKKEHKIFISAVVLKTGDTDTESQRDPFAAENYRSFAKMTRVFAFVMKFCRKIKFRIARKNRGLEVPDLIPITKGFQKVIKYEYDKKRDIVVKNESVVTYLKESVLLHAVELEMAEVRLVYLHQQRCFKKEIKVLRTSGRLLLSHKLIKLDPVLMTHRGPYISDNSKFQLLRLSGRFKNAEHLSEKMRHPFLLHPDSEFTRKLVQHYHGTVLRHMGGINCLLCEINSAYWIAGTIPALKRIINECVKCRKLRPKPTIQQMAPLPMDRIPGDREATRPVPFEVTALDAAGPWYTTQGRGKSKTKRWLLIFRCAKFGAIHHEMLYHMSADSFLKAMRRFIDHNPRPRKIYCDKGTNFVAGEKEINNMWREMDVMKIKQQARTAIPGPVIEFHFAPPEAHHFSGLVERYVGVAKQNLMAILQKDGLTDEDLITAFKDVQRLLNNRPIDIKSFTDPNDLQPLTPADFLRGGKVLEDLTPSGMSNEERSPVKSYWVLSKIMDQFWHRLVRGMAPYLRSYNKWITKRDQIKKGDVVCLLEENPDPNSHHRLAVVVEVTPGTDGIVRRVKVRTQNGKVYDRALNRIYVIVPAEQAHPSSKDKDEKVEENLPPQEDACLSDNKPESEPNQADTPACRSSPRRSKRLRKKKPVVLLCKR